MVQCMSTVTHELLDQVVTRRLRSAAHRAADAGAQSVADDLLDLLETYRESRAAAVDRDIKPEPAPRPSTMTPAWDLVIVADDGPAEPVDESPSDEEIRRILENPHGRRWTIQGFGMLRTYLTEDERVRLHVWSRADEVPGVSVIHDHPWDFTSRVVSGVVRNVRYMAGGHEPHWTRLIVCGPGGCALGTPERVMLGAYPDDVHGPGDRYSQAAEVLHASFPSDGAVTVITRRFGADRDVARVCWPDAAGSNGWVSAEPREATHEEVERITALALANWGGTPVPGGPST